MRLNKAFTILELSLVISIIGILLAGVMQAKSMINQANIRSIITDFTEIDKAVTNIRSQYNAWPGDMSYRSYTAVSPIAANGNGNNVIESTPQACNSPESIRAWNHLYYTNNYSLLLSGSSPSSIPCISIGINVPGSKIAGGFYFLWNAAGNSGSMFNVPTGNIIHFGSISTSDNSVNGSILSAQDSSSLDGKIDDGIANTGKIFAIDGNEVTTGTCSNSWSSTGANYNYTNSSIGCRIVYFLEK